MRPKKKGGATVVPWLQLSVLRAFRSQNRPVHRGDSRTRAPRGAGFAWNVGGRGRTSAVVGVHLRTEPPRAAGSWHRRARPLARPTRARSGRRSAACPSRTLRQLGQRARSALLPATASPCVWVEGLNIGESTGGRGLRKNVVEVAMTARVQLRTTARCDRSVGQQFRSRCRSSHTGQRSDTCRATRSPLASRRRRRRRLRCLRICGPQGGRHPTRHDAGRQGPRGPRRSWDRRPSYRSCRSASTHRGTVPASYLTSRSSTVFRHSFGVGTCRLYTQT